MSRKARMEYAGAICQVMACFVENAEVAGIQPKKSDWTG